MPIQLVMTGAVELTRSLERLKTTIGSGSSTAIGRRLGLEGLRIVKKLTPRNRSRNRHPLYRSRGDPFRDQWRLIEGVSTQNAYRAVIRNKAVKTMAGRVALASVEFGAEGHPIPKSGTTKMFWREAGTKRSFVGRTGLGPTGIVEETFRRRRQRAGDVFAWSVNHPGNEPFHMVADTRIQMQRVATALLVDFQKQIAAIFGPLSVSVR